MVQHKSCSIIIIIRNNEERATKAASALEIMTGSNSSNATTTCYDLGEAPAAILAIHTSLIAVIVLVTLLGNGLVLIQVARYKVLRTRSVIASLSLIVADVLWGLCYHFPALVSAASSGWQFGKIGCSAFGLLSFEFLLTRWLVMAVICVDRFCTVRFPFSYTKYSKCIIVVLTVAAWVVPLLLAFFPIAAKFSHGSFRPNIPTCLFNCQDADRLCRLYYGVVISFSFIVGAIVPTILYVWLYRRARRLRPTTVVLGQLSLQTAIGPLGTNQTVCDNHTDRWSREIQGYITFILIVMTFVATASPAYALQIFRTTDFEDWCKIPIVVHFIVQLIFFSSTALDPLVIMRDQDFRRCLKHMFCCANEDLFVDDVVARQNGLPRPSMDMSILNDEEKFTFTNGGHRSTSASSSQGSHSSECIHSPTPLQQLELI